MKIIHYIFRIANLIIRADLKSHYPKLISGLNIILLLIIVCSCKEQKISDNRLLPSYHYELVKTKKNKCFELDAETRYNAFYLYVFTDEKGEEYLSFLNYRTNQILFYDFKTCKFLFKIEMDKEGVDGVNLLSGYYIKDFNNIYVSSYSIPGLIKTDTTGKIRQKILYGQTPEGYQIVPSYTPSSRPYIPPVFIGDKLYITQQAANHIYAATKTPVSVIIDTLHHSYEQLPFLFGDILPENYFSQHGETRFSREYNGDHFIYSFYADEYIYVTSASHREIDKIHIKSKYIDKIETEEPPSDPNLAVKWILEKAHYGDMIYDQYREIYYRLVYPDTELVSDRTYMGTVVFGRNKFSVIILDKHFNIIGETLFPENIYNPFVFFIHPDGLYISRDYQINFDQPEDQMNFELFKLTSQNTFFMTKSNPLYKDINFEQFQTDIFHVE